MQDNSNAYLVHFSKDEHIHQNPKLLRVILDEHYTRIDFGYLPEWIYIKGGWITIAPETYIRIKGSEKKFKLTEAKGIPITPQKWEFESKMDWKVFSLFFEPIPRTACTIDIIESLSSKGNFFNYFNITLSMENRIVCMDAL
jgi:hypothetical protein